MPEKIKKLFYQKLTYEKLIAAHYRAKKHKSSKGEILRYELNLESNIMNLLDDLKNKRYRVGAYRQFMIYEPKARIIKSLPYKDRIVHQWIVEEFIKPYITPRLIETTFACIVNRGTHASANQMQRYMRRLYNKNIDYWVLKCDIRKFFYSINPEILYKILQKYISDADLLYLIKIILFDNRDPNDKIGIPIGNYTSQYFANIYLNELDQYIKRTLKVKYYVRYMDDFVLLLPNKEECKRCKKLISDFLAKNLELSLNEKTKYYPCKMGVDFCGYRLFPTHALLRNSNKTKIKNCIRRWNKQYANHTLNVNHAIMSFNSWYGHAIHCNSYNLINRMINKCAFLESAKNFSETEKYLISLIEEDKRQARLKKKSIHK